MKIENKYNLKSRRYIFLYGCILAIFFVILFLPCEVAQGPEFSNIELEYSLNEIDWFDVDGTLESGFDLWLNSSATYYYLNFKNTTTTNWQIAEGFYGFNITSHPSGFFTYWASKGVDASAVNGTWQAHAWQIINGNSPTFYIHVDSSQNFRLIDGLQKDYLGDNTSLLRVNGDYPLGSFCYNGTITSWNSTVSSPIEVSMLFLQEPGSSVWVDDYYDASTPGWGVTHFNNINDGIAASVSGGIVNVKPGTYNELVIIDRSIVLRSTLGADYTTISDFGATYSEFEASGGHTVQFASNDIWIDGFTIERYTFSSDHAVSAIGNNGSAGISNVKVSYCKIDSIHDSAFFADIDNVTLYWNWFNARPDDTAIILERANDFVIHKNNITDYNLIGISVDNCSGGLIKTVGVYRKFLIGISINNSDDIEVSYIDFLDNFESGLFINNSVGIDVLNCYFENNEYGLNLGDNTVIYLHNSLFNGNTFARYHAVESLNEIFYSEIQAAIDNVGVNDSGVVLSVNPGLYRENLVINKEIGLAGVDLIEDTIIDGTGGNATIDIARDNDIMNVVLSDLKIIGDGYCVRTGQYRDVSGLLIEDCIIEASGNDSAVLINPFQNSDQPPIRNGTDPFSSPVNLVDNEVIGGVYFRYLTHELYGIHLDIQLYVIDNDIDWMYLNGSSSIEIYDNNFDSLGMEYSNDINIYNNVFENPVDVLNGIYLFSKEGTPPVKIININHNLIGGYSKGILIAGASDVVIDSNELSGNIDGIYVSEDYTSADGETCFGNVYDIDIINNNVYVGHNGIKLDQYVNGSEIYGNAINYFNKGISFKNSANNIIKDNIISNNYLGLFFDVGCSHSLIYNNYFAENTFHTSDIYSIYNRWNIDLTAGTNIMGGLFLGGNFWDTYMGEDLNGDSIGDTNTPFNCSGGIVNGGDYLPLLFADYDPPIVQVLYPDGGEIFNVNATINIVWNASDDVDAFLSIDIEYSNDSGGIWHVISLNETNHGSYEWNISDLPEGSQYLVKVSATDKGGNNNSDMSDGTFSIVRDFAEPKVVINSPYMGYLYFFNVQKARFFSNNCFIIGHIVIEAEVNTYLDLEKVEFRIDDELMATSYEDDDGIYSWEWDEFVLFYHVIKVVAYDVNGGTGSEEIGVTIFNYNIIP